MGLLLSNRVLCMVPDTWHTGMPAAIVRMAVVIKRNNCHCHYDETQSPGLPLLFLQVPHVTLAVLFLCSSLLPSSSELLGAGLYPVPFLLMLTPLTSTLCLIHGICSAHLRKQDHGPVLLELSPASPHTVNPRELGQEQRGYFMTVPWWGPP